MKLSELLGDAYKDGMTTEEIAAALENVTAPASEPPVSNDGELERLKAAVTKANSEAAAFKKQLQSRMSEDEKKEAERAESEKALKAQLKALQRTNAISEATKQFMALGYEASLADEVAKATADGDSVKVFAGQKKHLEAVEKRIRAEMLKETPKPAAGGQSGRGITQEQFDAMGYTERAKLFKEDNDLYNELTGGNENG